jgi:enoyl-CoA hydratase
MQTYVSFEREDDIGYLTFACDEPNKPATLDLQVLDELSERTREIRSSIAQLRAVVVRSNSKRYFVVGANINALETLNPETIVPWVQKGHVVLNQLESLPIPVIARVEGYVLGGGLELAMACDMIVASRDTKLGQPEANLGLVAGWGGSYRLSRRVGLARAKEMFFTAKIITAEEAYRMGLVNYVGDSAEVEAYLLTLLEGIRSCSALAVSQMKKLINDSSYVTVEQGSFAEAVASSICLASDDTKSRVAEFFESRQARGQKTE